LLGGQFAETAESGDAGVFTDADQGDALRRHAELAEASEDLDDLELIVQIRLEPQHVLAVVVGRQGPIPIGEHLRTLRAVVHASLDQEGGSDLAEFLGTHRRHRPLVERVPPVQHPGREPGPRQIRGIAVAHVQSRQHRLVGGHW
jgi:hypothetical protein